MPYRPEGSRTGVVDAYVDVGVLAEAQGEIGRHGREADAVGSHQAPALTAKEFPLAALEVEPVQAEASGVRVRAHKDVGGRVAIEIAFDIRPHFVLLEGGVDPQVQAGILAGDAEFGQVAGYGVAERDRPKAGSGRVTGIGRTEDVFEIHEAARSKLRGADAE